MFDFDPKDVIRAEMQAAASATALGGMVPGREAPQRKLSDVALRVAREAVTNPISPVVVTGTVRLIEWALIALVGGIIYGFYLGASLGFSWTYVPVILAGATLALISFELAGLYRLPALRNVRHQGPRLVAGWSATLLVILAAMFFLKIGDHYSRLWLGLWFAVGLGVIAAFRTGVYVMVSRWTRERRLERRAVIVGGGKTGEDLINALTASPESDIKICGVFDDRNDDRSPESCSGFPKLGNVDDLVEFARQTRIDLLIVALPISAESRVLQMLKTLWVLPLDIRLSAHTNKLRFRPRSYSYIGDVPFLDVFDKPLADWNVVIKWVFDKIIGTLMLIGLSPVMLATAIAIKLDSKGPALFRQKRHGFNNELIEVFKFRSMYTDQCDARAAKLVTKDDPRVTRVGRFIRKTSLDELPQLFNVVFKGNLSLVGPRPHALSAKAGGGLYQDVVDGYFARHKVKPGITGWAQVNGWRGETDTHEKIQKRVEHDLYYIENWSPFFDLYILALTPISLMSKTESAY